MKALIVATTINFITHFELNDIKILQDLGYEVHVAGNLYVNGSEETERRLANANVTFHQIDFQRSPFKPKNIKAYNQLKGIIKSTRFDLIHCHTPVGGAMTRLVAKKERKKGTKIIYTAHGFHFYKGAPLLNWLIYYPVEKLLAKHTDVLLTINKEDYERASKQFKAKKVQYIPGVGVDTSRFTQVTVDRTAKRKELGVPEDCTLLVSVGELNANKNHQIILRALAELNNPNLYYCIAGKGILKDYLIELSKELNIEKQFKLLGQRNDIAEILKSADIFCFPSYREGLSVSLMEAMGSGLPVIASKIRGNVDLIDDGLGGFLFDPNDVRSAVKAIEKTIKEHNKEKMIENATETTKQFDIKNVDNIMRGIFAVGSTSINQERVCQK